MRFIRICDSYLNHKDRDLFVEEFVRLTWDKPDLTADELNLYMNVCKDIVNGEVLTSHISTLNEMFSQMGDDPTEFSVKFSEMLGAKTSEYQQNQKRVSDTIKKLQGDRSDRLKNLAKDETSFVSIVQLAQEEQERKNMLRLAELQRAAISEEANRLENMDDFVCRIFGVAKEEVL
jgi:tRNA uridine 5-carbamoylmethylation protein Kti12